MNACECSNIKDPFKNEVTIPDELCAELDVQLNHEMGGKITDIIEKPALVIQSLNLEKMYYLRQYDFDTSVLIKTKKCCSGYTAYEFLINPCKETMKSLIIQAKILS